MVFYWLRDSVLGVTMLWCIVVCDLLCCVGVVLYLVVGIGLLR